MATLADVKRQFVVGAMFDVTNHYIDPEKAPNHPCRGTTRRVVTAVTGSSYTLGFVDPERRAQRSGRDWPEKFPKASNVVLRDGGTFEFYGHPKPGDLFLTFVPVGHTSNLP